MVWASLTGHLPFHVKRAHASAAEGDVDHLLVCWQKFLSQRGHVHTMCESFIRIK